MSLIISKNNVIFAGIKIGRIEIRKGKKCFISYATYERHIYRKLNAWTVNAEVLEIPEIKFIFWEIPGQKTFGISIKKLRKFMESYNCYLQGFRNYKKLERQVAVPVSICDSKAYGNFSSRSGISIAEFTVMISDPHTVYLEWNNRKTGNQRSWSV